jgi:hypothetical protein
VGEVSKKLPPGGGKPNKKGPGCAVQAARRHRTTWAVAVSRPLLQPATSTAASSAAAFARVQLPFSMLQNAQLTRHISIFCTLLIPNYRNNHFHTSYSIFCLYFPFRISRTYTFTGSFCKFRSAGIVISTRLQAVF